MTDQTRGQSADKAETVLIRVQDSVYAVPLAAMERHRVGPEERTRVEAAWREEAGDADATAHPTIPAGEPIYAFTRADLAPYRLSDEEREAVEAGDDVDEADVQGFQLIGQFVPWMPPTAGPTYGGLGGAFDWGVNRSKPWYVVNHNLVRSEPYPGLR